MVLLAASCRSTAAIAPAICRSSIWASASSWRAPASSQRPVALSCRPRPTRSNRAQSQCPSSSFNAALQADCDNPSAVPAAAVLPLSTTLTNTWS